MEGRFGSITLRSIILGSIILIGLVSVAMADDYSQWQGSVSVVLNTKSSGADVSGAVTAFPVLVRLTSSDSAVFLASQPGGKDIRFAKNTGTHLPYQIEQWDPATRNAAIWVLLDTVRGNDSAACCKLYYGNSGAADSSSGKAVFDTANGFQGVWHLGEASGSDAADATANSITGTATGSPAPQDYQGIVGRAKDFDGASSCFALSGTASGKLNFPAGGPMTFSAWIFTDAVNGGKYVISKGEEYGLYFRSTAPYKFGMVEVGSDNRKRYAEKDTSGMIGSWRHIVGIRTSAKISLYLDGQWVSDSTSAGTATRSTSADVNIGRQQPNSNQWFDGKIDEVEMSSVARSADWIKLSFQNQKPAQALVRLIPTGTPTLPPAAPVLAAPTNGSTNVSVAPTLSWGPAAGATTYRVQLSSASAFTSTVVDDSSLAFSSRAVSGLANSTVYFWRVSAKNSAGKSAWTAAWSFTTVIAPPAAPALSSPTNGAMIGMARDFSITLGWNSTTSAASYTLQISTTSGFSSTILSTSSLTATSLTINAASYGVRMNYWRVAAVNTGGTGAWSSVWRFAITGVSVLRETAPVRAADFSVNGCRLVYSLPTEAAISILFADMTGRIVRSITRSQSRGRYAIDLRESLPAGRYLVRFRSGVIDRRVPVTVIR